MKCFVLGESTTFGCIYYRKLVIIDKREPILQSPPSDPSLWKEGVDFKINQIPSFKMKVVVKKSMAESLVMTSHKETCHGGRNAMRYYLKNYFIEKKEALINQFRICDDCDALKSLPEELPFTPIESNRPFERMQFDFTFFKGKSIFTLIDHFTKYAFAYVTPTRKTSLVIDLIDQSISKLKKKGNIDIKILQSDNGAEFCSESMKSYCEENSFALVHGRVRHPQSQGCIERFHRTLKSNLKLLISSERTFDQAIIQSVKSYNNTFHNTVFILLNRLIFIFLEKYI